MFGGVINAGQVLTALVAVVGVPAVLLGYIIFGEQVPPYHRHPSLCVRILLLASHIMRDD